MAQGRDESGRFVRGAGSSRSPATPGSSGDFEIGENLTGWKAIERALETMRAGGSYVKAGVVGEAANTRDGETMTNAKLAAIHEFGTATIPARPFVLGTFNLNGPKYRALLASKILPAILRLKITPAAGLKLLGEMMSSDMRNRIVEDPSPFAPNAPSTVRAKLRRGAWNRKGKAGGVEPRPLVNTGRLRNSLSYAVVIQDQEGEP